MPFKVFFKTNSFHNLQRKRFLESIRAFSKCHLCAFLDIIWVKEFSIWGVNLPDLCYVFMDYSSAILFIIQSLKVR